MVQPTVLAHSGHQRDMFKYSLFTLVFELQMIYSDVLTLHQSHYVLFLSSSLFRAVQLNHIDTCVSQQSSQLWAVVQTTYSWCTSHPKRKTGLRSVGGWVKRVNGTWQIPSIWLTDTHRQKDVVYTQQHSFLSEVRATAHCLEVPLEHTQLKPCTVQPGIIKNKEKK